MDMSKTPVNWIGDRRPASSATSGAFHELEQSREIDTVRRRMAMRTASARDSLFASAWKTFAAAFVVLMLISQLVPLHPGMDVVVVAKKLADPILTSSH
jgi:hypothetical protein